MTSSIVSSCLTLRHHVSCTGLLLMAFSFSFHEFAQGQSCTPTIPPKNKCSCSYDDGTGAKTPIDFEPLGNKDNKAAFAYTVNGDYKYAYNPCFPFTDNFCSDVAACQVATKDQTIHFDIGDPDTPEFSVDGGDIVITYTSGDRHSIVNFHCDPSALNAATYTVNGEDPVGSSKYKFTIGTCLACVPAIEGCPGSGSSGLSVGGILCIVFTVLLLVYLVGGILFQKYARGATGKEMIPNYSFWSDFPTLIKDGFMFLVGLCKGTSTDYEAIK